jgi:hypothetical protein
LSELQCGPTVVHALRNWPRKLQALAAEQAVLQPLIPRGEIPGREFDMELINLRTTQTTEINAFVFRKIGVK